MDNFKMVPVAWDVHWSDDGSEYVITRSEQRAHDLGMDKMFIVEPLYKSPQAFDEAAELEAFRAWYPLGCSVGGVSGHLAAKQAWLACARLKAGQLS